MKVVILHNIRSHYNVGAIMRTADAAGVSRVYLCGYTPTPTDRFGRAVKELHKTALGAEKFLPWTHFPTTLEAIVKCREEGCVVVAVEQSEHAISLRDLVVPDRVAYVFGSEVEGLASDIVAACDKVVFIPMLGKKESLNVSVAAGIVLYH